MRSKKTTCLEQCPVQRTADLIEGKWTLVIVRDLLGGPKRYAELRDSVGEISPRMLAMRLQHLTGNGLVSRKVIPTIPPGTEYALTKLGLELQPLIASMAQFGRRVAAVEARQGKEKKA